MRWHKVLYTGITRNPALILTTFDDISHIIRGHILPTLMRCKSCWILLDVALETFATQFQGVPCPSSLFRGMERVCAIVKYVHLSNPCCCCILNILSSIVTDWAFWTEESALVCMIRCFTLYFPPDVFAYLVYFSNLCIRFYQDFQCLHRGFICLSVLELLVLLNVIYRTLY